MTDVLFLTTPHMRGPAVKQLQTALTLRGWYHGPIDSDLGVLTSQAIYRAKYWFGFAKPDHLAGPYLWSFLSGVRKPTLVMQLRIAARKKAVPKVPVGERLLKSAIAFIGTKEYPSDSNIVLFSKWYGLIGAWCAMFVSYCANHFGYSQFRQGQFVAYVPYLVSAAREGRDNLVIVHWNNVQAGDIVAYDWNGDGEADHTGFFEAKTGDTTFTAVEGNTSLSNDSNGGEVMRRDRNLSTVQAFIRITK